MTGGDAAVRLVEALQARVKVKTDGPDRWRAQCPAHGGHGLNLSVARGDQGVLVKCWSHDCAAADIAQAVGLGLSDLFDTGGRARYDYGGGYVIERRRRRTEHGDGKTIAPVAAGITPKVRPLWTPPGSAPLADSPTVMLAEGEKCADALIRLGAPCAATWAGGAQSVARADWAPLAGRHVVIVPDNDTPGIRAAQALVELLTPICADVHLWQVPAEYDGHPLNDAADLWQAGGTLDDLQPSGPTTDDGMIQDQAVAAEVDRLRVRDEARRLYAEQQHGARPPLPAPEPLGAFLAVADTDPDYRVRDLMPTGGNVILAAQYKAGKSTLIGNLIRALVDGAPFLGMFPVDRPAGRVVLIDDELDPRTLRRWLRDQGIVHTDAVAVLPLRGKVGTFDILDDAVRAEWARTIGQADVLILDCLRPVLDALGLDENHDAGRFLVALDALTGAAQIGETITVHHMGHNGERSRGDSRILDWPDVTWRIVRESPDDPASPRYFSAFGRDVDVPEGRLEYHEATRALTLAEGNRRQARDTAAVDEMLPVVLAYVTANPGCSSTRIMRDVPGWEAGKRQARDVLIESGRIEKRPRVGKGGGYAYYPVTPATPAEPQRAVVTTPATPVYKRGLGLELVPAEPQHEENEPQRLAALAMVRAMRTATLDTEADR